ncbi:MAG: type II toxin-antitoxin system HicB family antitoxin [Dehalococcoidia bacterium]|nr:type II toxin-antitoxin system HicB family antitoxin [Dehalococcoidia bacterium]
MKYTVIIEKGQESGYVAYCPALRGCVSQGETKDQALRNIKEAAEVYLEALLEDGIAVPVEIGKESVEVEVEVMTK